MAIDFVSTADAPSAENGSGAPLDSPPSVRELSLSEVVHELLLQMAETNQHLRTMTQQNAMLIDLLTGDNQDEDAASSYLDGTPILG
jgi:hypothetical protein